MASDLSHTRIAIRKSKVPFIIMAIAAAAAFYPATITHIEESRLYRDVANLTPFKSVEIEKVSVSGSTMTVWGSFEKVRCTKTGHHAYTRRDSGQNHLADFSAADEHPLTPANRPKTGRSEPFGPWVITSSIADPAYASFYPVHKCNGIIQSDRFFELPWTDYQTE